MTMLTGGCRCGDPVNFRSSSIAIRQFCAACGTPLSFRYRASDHVALTIGSFDEPARVRPAIHYGIEAKVSWLHEIFAAGLPEEPTGEDPPSLQGMVNFQHPDHETDQDWHSPR